MFKRNIVFSFLFIVSISSILFSGYYTNDGIVEHDQYGWIDQTTGTLLSDNKSFEVFPSYREEFIALTNPVSRLG